MRIIRAALRRRYARIRKNARRRRDADRRRLNAQQAPRRPGLVAAVRVALSRARVGRAIEAAFLAAVVGACGPTVPRGEVGEGGAVHGLLRACVRLGESADGGNGAARAWFNGFCAPFFGWEPAAPSAEVTVTSPMISPWLLEAVGDG